MTLLYKYCTILMTQVSEDVICEKIHFDLSLAVTNKNMKRLLLSFSEVYVSVTFLDSDGQDYFHDYF